MTVTFELVSLLCLKYCTYCIYNSLRATVTPLPFYDGDDDDDSDNDSDDDNDD